MMDYEANQLNFQIETSWGLIFFILISIILALLSLVFWEEIREFNFNFNPQKEYNLDNYKKITQESSLVYRHVTLFTYEINNYIKEIENEAIKANLDKIIFQINFIYEKKS